MMTTLTAVREDSAFSPAPARGPDVPATRGYLRVHLQWFAAEDEGRTEEPTEYRIKKAREEGRLSKSPELVGAVGLLLPFMTLVIAAPSMFGILADMIAHYFSLVSEADPLGQGRAIVGAAMGYFLRLAAPVAAVAVVSALASNLLQTGFNFTLKPITPDFSRIVPRFGQYFKRILFSMEGIYNLIKSMVKIASIVLIAWINISGEFAKLANLYSMGLHDSLEFVSGIAVRVVLEASLVLLAFSVVDILYQRWQYRERLKMTKEEVKEERKMYEGDPLVKGRLREKMRELVSRNVAKAVPESTVVVTNPTHYAVALKWEEAAMSAPEVTAKGADDAALRIRRIALDSGVPIVENRPLARALYAEAEIGDAIPEKYYEAIAGLIAHVYMMDEKEKARAAARAAG